VLVHYVMLNVCTDCKALLYCKLLICICCVSSGSLAVKAVKCLYWRAGSFEVQCYGVHCACVLEKGQCWALI
jgi:hypothetical protein